MPSIYTIKDNMHEMAYRPTIHRQIRFLDKVLDYCLEIQSSQTWYLT